MARYALIIDGQTVEADRSFDVVNPSDGSLVGAAPAASLTQLDAAVEAAARAFKRWSMTPDEAREAACVALADKLKAHAEELAQLLTREQGKPLNGMGSRFELGGAEAWCRYTAGLKLPIKVLQDGPGGRVELHRKPIGVVGSITPWNWPIMIAIWHIIPAIRTGNTVVIKPSPQTPLSTIRMVELLNEILEPGILNCVTGGNEIGAAMSEHPGIHKIVFTGSIRTGKKVMQSGATTLKRMTLELGGNDAGIVLPNTDPKVVAEGIFWGAFVNNGQTCAALKRLYVHDSIYDATCAALVDFAKGVKVGDGLAPDSILGPVQNKMQFDIVRRLVDSAIADGAKVLMGANPEPNQKGYFYPVTLIAEAKDGMALVDEEQFGPALPIIRYHDVDDAIARANANENGLGGSVWSSDPAAAKAAAQRLECGSAWVNKHGAIQPNVPFGGVKSSGVGVEFAEEGLVEYTTIQSVYC